LHRLVAVGLDHKSFLSNRDLHSRAGAGGQKRALPRVAVPARCSARSVTIFVRVFPVGRWGGGVSLHKPPPAQPAPPGSIPTSTPHPSPGACQIGGNRVSEEAPGVWSGPSG